MEEIAATETRILDFRFGDRYVKGIYIDVDGKNILVKITHDSDNKFKVGDTHNIDRGFLDRFSDEIFIERIEYSRLNTAQKWLGKHYFGLPLVVLILWAIWYFSE